MSADPEHDDVTRHSFERQARLFEGPDSPFARRSGSLAWIEPLEPDMIVLDVACGAGHGAEPVAALVRQLVGIDLTPSLLTLGARRLQEKGVSNVLLQEGNAETLPFVDESFEVVFCRSSLHHFSDPQKAVAEMVRVCRPGGRIVLLDIVPPDADVRERFDHVHRLLDPSHVGSFLEAELAELLPGGREELTYSDTFTFRLPIDVAITEQSDAEEVFHMLREEALGRGKPTGFEPTQEGESIVVSFTTSVVHGRRPSVGWMTTQVGRPAGLEA
jgi:SAM-dependent methyltransferase